MQQNDKYIAAHKRRHEYNGKVYAYRTVHNWIRNIAGKADHCEGTKCTNKSVCFEWANISRKYKLERSDWIQLCKACHSKMDMTDHIKNTLFTYRKIVSRPVAQYSLDGTFIKVWPSRTDAAKGLNTSLSNITGALRGDRKTSKGYIWKDFTNN